jgi:paraquat-inducible protein B
MSGTDTPAAPPPGSPRGPAEPPLAHARHRHRFSLVWLIPIVAALIAAYLGYRTISERGPLITITFSTGAGLTAGQTTVQHKSVALGTVERVRLAADMKQVIVSVRMNAESTPRLTDHAAFWVVRPRLTAGSISGLETVISGAYIEFDPGDPGGKPQREFAGLDEPPGVRSDEPGRTFTIMARRLGSLNAGAPIFYRDMPVGEVLSHDQPGLTGPVPVHIFIRKPFDDFVRQDSHFWNVSGLSVGLGPTGVHVEVASLQAVLSGGIAFDTPGTSADQKPAPANAKFELYPDYQTAQAAGLHTHIPLVVYTTDSVSGLSRGSSVEFLGLQIGLVTEVKLELQPSGEARVRIAFDVQPERVFPDSEIHLEQTGQLAQNLVARGLRVQIATSNYITGQRELSLAFFPDAPPATVGREGDAFVLPSQPGDFASILSSAGQFMGKLNQLPLNQIAESLNGTLKSLDSTVSSPELKQALTSLSGTLVTVQDAVRKIDNGLTPTLARLPAIAQQLQDAVGRANRVLSSVDQGYGANSDFKRDVDRLMWQVNDTARSIRLLADFLDRHPEALIRGRTGQATER